MAIGQAGRSWDPGDEFGITKAIRVLELTATTEADAKFLADLSCCIRRGKADAGELAAFAGRLLSRQAADAMIAADRRHHEHHGTAGVDESLATIIDDQIREDEAETAGTAPADPTCPNPECLARLVVGAECWECPQCGWHGDVSDMEDLRLLWGGMKPDSPVDAAPPVE